MRVLRIGMILAVCFMLVSAAYAEDCLEITGPEIVYPRQIFEIALVIDAADVTKITFDLDLDWNLVQMMALWTDDSNWQYETDTMNHVVQRLQPGTSDSQTVFWVRLRVRTENSGDRVWFAMKNVVLWSGETSVQVGDVIWERTVARVISDDSYLSSLRISDAVLSPEFSPYQQNYTATVAHFVPQVSVEAIPASDGASVEIESPALEYGMTSNVTVTVTAEDGSVRVYTIAVTREDAPEREPSGNCDLRELVVTDYKLSPVFQPEVTDYVLWLPYEATGVDITATPSDSRATVTIVGNKGLKAGQDNLIYVTCTAENGTQKIYAITAKRAEVYAPPASETAAMPAATLNGEVYAVASDVPAWVYVVVVVAAVTGCAAVGILITDRKKS